MPQTLELILLLLGAAVIAVVVCRQFRLPPILGYLMVGLAVGPHALAWVPDSADVRDLAEFGIVFLMFSIGLEFSLPQLKSDAARRVRARPRAGDHHYRGRDDRPAFPRLWMAGRLRARAACSR